MTRPKTIDSLQLRGLWLAVAVLAAMLAAVVAALLAVGDGMGVPQVATAAGATFAATTGLVLGAVRFLTAGG